MAKPKVSLDPDDALVGGGLFGPGRAKILKARFGKYTYPNKAGVATQKPKTSLLVTYKRDEEKHIAPYTCGDGFKPSEDGLTLIPIGAQTQLVDTTNCMRLFKSFKEHGMPKDVFAELSSDVSIIEKVVVDLVRKTLPKFEGRTPVKLRPGQEERDRSLLLIDEIVSAPWAKGKKKPKDDDEEDGDEAENETEDSDEEEEEEEEESDDSESDEDEDEDEKPKKKAKKKKPADDDDEEEAEDEDDAESDDDDKDTDDEDESDEDVDEDLLEATVECLIDAVEAGPIKKAKVQDLVTATAKKKKKYAKQAKAIGALAAKESTLKQERGWSYNGKTVTGD